MFNEGVVCLFTSQCDSFPISMNLHSFVWKRKTKILTLVILLLNVTSCLQMSVAEDKWDFWRTSGVCQGVGVLVLGCCLPSGRPVQCPDGFKQRCRGVPSSALSLSQLPCNVQFNFLTRTGSWDDILMKVPILALRFNSLKTISLEFITLQQNRIYFPQSFLYI